MNSSRKDNPRIKMLMKFLSIFDCDRLIVGINGSVGESESLARVVNRDE